MPVQAFTLAWRADSIPYAQVRSRMWSGFQRLRDVAPADALDASLPAAVAWLEDDRPDRVPPGSVGGADAAITFADRVKAGLAPAQREGLIWFPCASAHSGSQTRSIHLLRSISRTPVRSQEPRAD